MREDSRHSIVVQGGILAAAGILTKILGFAYRIPMANLLGEQGNGIYSVAFDIYNIALTLSSYSLPAAVSKMISERLGRRQKGGARHVLRVSLCFALAAGLAAFAILFLGAGVLEHLYHRQGLARPLRVLAPTAFVVAALGVLRGWFQGRGNMVPTAISQVLEQVVNAAVSLLATWQFMRAFAASGDAASYGAAGGTMGTLAGAGAALLFLGLLYGLGRSGAEPGRLRDRAESDRAVLRVLVMTVLPLILSQTIYQLGSTLDDLLFGRVMEHKGVSDVVASSLLGVYNTQYNQMTTMPVAVTTAMAASLLPGIALLNAQGRRAEARRKIRTVVKLNMAVAFPAAVGLGVLAGPIMRLLFPSLTEYQSVATGLLQTGSAAVIFYALSTITAAVLQGSDFLNLPVANAALALMGHVALVFLLLRCTDLGIYVLVVGNVTFPLTLALLNCFAVRRCLRYRWEYGRTFGIPAVSAALMGFAVRGIYAGLGALGAGLPSALLAAVLSGAVFYGVVLLRVGCFTREELQELPKSRLLLRIAGYR